MDTTEFSGRRALVTGGTKGMGLAIVQRLKAAGARVVTTARTTPDDFDPAVKFIQADISTTQGVARVVEETLSALGGLDVLIHNVGSSASSRGGALVLDLENWQKTFETNLFSVVQLDRAFLPQMIKQKAGSIIHVTSINAQRPTPELIAYSAAKAALANYSRSLAVQFAGQGIRVNTVAPGFIETEGALARMQQMAQSAGTDMTQARAQIMEILGGVPLGRLGRPEEIAEVVAFMASDRAAYITGRSLLVDGGCLTTI